MSSLNDTSNAVQSLQFDVLCHSFTDFHANSLLYARSRNHFSIEIEGASTRDFLNMYHQQRFQISCSFFSSGVKHQRVSCDECHQRSVSGIRWKCVQCHDYDLCTGCYMGGKHNCNHIFLRYANVQPKRYALMWSLQKFCVS